MLVREQEVPHWGYESLEHLHVATLAEARRSASTSPSPRGGRRRSSLFHVPAERYAYFVQSLEDRFYQPDDPESAFGAALTLDLPVAFITEARWIADTLRELRPDAPVHLVRNGIDKDGLRAAGRGASPTSTGRCASSSRATPTSGSRT